jgi:hypothetical protein
MIFASHKMGPIKKTDKFDLIFLLKLELLWASKLGWFMIPKFGSIGIA